MEDVLTYGIFAWFSEYKVTPIDVVDAAYLAPGVVTGHFLQTSHDINTALGCAVVIWEVADPVIPNWVNKFTRVTCNYRKSPYGGDPLYSIGETGSQCEFKDKGCDYYGLCLPKFVPECVDVKN